MATDIEKGRAVLLSLSSDCDGEWRKCRHCLASEEVEQPAVRDAIRLFIAEFDRLAALDRSQEKP